MYSKYDFYQAELYANQYLLKFKYEKLKLRYPYIFLHSSITERQAENTDYYVPPKIIDSCKVFKITFDEIGCEKINCFPLQENAKPCDTWETKVLRFGSHFTFACQPSCKYFYKDPLFLDTKYKNGKCVKDNYFKKLAALKPRARMETTLDISDDNHLRLTDEYCAAHGLVLNSEGSCETTTGQDVGEFFVGESIYRLTTVKLYPPKPPQGLVWPVIPDHIKDKTSWQDVSALTGLVFPPPMALIEEAHVFMEDAEAVIEGHTSPDLLNLLEKVAVGLAVDTVIEISALKLQAKLLKWASESTLKRFHAATLVRFIKFKTFFKPVSMVLKTASTAIGIATVAYAVFSIASMIIDFFDVGDFNMVLLKAEVDKLDKYCDMYFNYFAPDEEITPEYIFSMLDDELNDNVETLELIEEKVMYYLNNLEDNYFGQRLTLGEEKAVREMHAHQLRLEKAEGYIRYSIYTIIKFVLTNVTIILSILFINWLPYVALVFLILSFIIQNVDVLHYA